MIHKEPVHEQIKKVVVIEEHDAQPNDTNLKKEHKTHSKKGHVHAHESTAEELKQNVEELLDGESERPGGAILSLSLGISISFV